MTITYPLHVKLTLPCIFFICKYELICKDLFTEIFGWICLNPILLVWGYPLEGSDFCPFLSVLNGNFLKENSLKGSSFYGHKWPLFQCFQAQYFLMTTYRSNAKNNTFLHLFHMLNQPICKIYCAQRIQTKLIISRIEGGGYPLEGSKFWTKISVLNGNFLKENSLLRD